MFLPHSPNSDQGPLVTNDLKLLLTERMVPRLGGEATLTSSFFAL